MLIIPTKIIHTNAYFNNYNNIENIQYFNVKLTSYLLTYRRGESVRLR